MLQEELAYVVDKEMIATSTAIEEAVLRMDVRIHAHHGRQAFTARSPANVSITFLTFQEILNQAKRETSGTKLEVNQR